MRSDQLIATLTADLKPVRVRSSRRDLLTLAGIGAVEVALFVAIGAARPDLRAAAMSPVLWWKLTTLAVVAGIGVVGAVRSFAPDRLPRAGLRWMFGMVAVALIVGIALGIGHPVAGTLIERLDWRHGIDCIVEMTALSIPAIAGIAWLARRGAPVDRGGTAVAAGVGAAAWGAFVFALACPSDDPLYITCWYLLGCGAITLAARAILARAMRW